MIPNAVGIQGEAFVAKDISIHFSDPDGDDLTFSMSGLPMDTGLVIDGMTGVITGTPTNDDAQATQPIVVTITADDNAGGMVTGNFDLAVTNVNDSPTLDSMIPDAMGTQGVAFMAKDISTHFSDPDGDDLTFSMSGLPVDTGLVIDGMTGVITGTPTNGDAQATQPIVITITADDNAGGMVTGNFDLAVTNVNDSPTLDSMIPDAMGTQGVAFMAKDISIHFSDPDGDDLTFSMSGLPMDTGLVIDGMTGVITGTPTNGDAQATQPIVVTITADDSAGGMVTGNFDLAVTNVNDSPTLDSMIPDAMGTQGVAFMAKDISTHFSDPDGDDLTFSMSGLPMDTGLVIDGMTGVITGTPTNGDAQATQPIVVTITADDNAGGMVTGNFDLAVTNVNDSPTLDSMIPDAVGTQGVAFMAKDISTHFSDPDGDNLTYSMSGLPMDTGLVIDGMTGVITGTPTNGDAQASQPIVVTITADDNVGGMVIGTFDLAVTNVNDFPTNVGLDNSAVEENLPVGTLIGMFTSDDPDLADIHSYSLVLGTGDTDNSLFQLVGNQLQNSSILDFEVKSILSIRIQSDDNNGGTIEKNFVITLSNTNDAPTFTGTHILARQNTPSEPITPIVDDQDMLDTHSFTVEEIAQNGVVTSVRDMSGQLTYAPNPDFLGVDAFTFRATDSGEGNLSVVGFGSVTVAPVVFFDQMESWPGTEGPLLDLVSLISNLGGLNNNDTGALRLDFPTNDTVSIHGANDLLDDLIAPSCQPTDSGEAWYYVDIPAGATGQLTFDTFGSPGLLDTVLEVFSGAARGGLNSIGCNDNSFDTDFSFVTIDSALYAGQRLHVMVDGVSEAMGEFKLRLNRGLPGDICDSAISVNFEPGGFLNIDSTIVGYTDTQTPECESNDNADAWFMLPVPENASGTLMIDTLSAINFSDTILEVFIGSCDNLISIACNDDETMFGTQRSEIELDVSLYTGQTLFVLFDADATETPDAFTLTFDFSFVTNIAD